MMLFTNKKIFKIIKNVTGNYLHFENDFNVEVWFVSKSKLDFSKKTVIFFSKFH